MNQAGKLSEEPMEGRRGTREIGRKVSHYEVQEGGRTSCRNPGWDVYRSSETQGVAEGLSAMPRLVVVEPTS